MKWSAPDLNRIRQGFSLNLSFHHRHRRSQQDSNLYTLPALGQRAFLPPTHKTPHQLLTSRNPRLRRILSNHRDYKILLRVLLPVPCYRTVNRAVRSIAVHGIPDLQFTEVVQTLSPHFRGLRNSNTTTNHRFIRTHLTPSFGNRSSASQSSLELSPKYRLIHRSRQSHSPAISENLRYSSARSGPLSLDGWPEH